MVWHRLGLMAAILFTLASVLGQGKDRELWEKGEQYLRTGSYDMALRSLEEAMKLSGGRLSAEPLYELYRLTGEYEKALDLAGKMDARRGKTLAGEVLMELGRYEEAREAFLAAYRLDPYNIRVQFNLGHYYFLRGQREKYIEYFDRIFTNYDPYENYTAEDLTYIAKACYIYAMKTSNEYLDRSDTLDTIVNTILPEAIEKDKYYFPAYREMIAVFLAAYEMPSSLAAIQNALKLNPHHPHILTAQANYQLQVIHENLRPQAVSTLDHALTINPRLVEALNLKATIYLADEEYEKAGECLKKALTVNPRDLNTMSLMAAFYYMQGRKAAYERVCGEVLSINPCFGNLYYTMGQMVVHKRKFSEAVAFHRKAIALDPYLWDAYIELGRHLLNIGEEEEAKKYLDKVQEEYNFHVQSFNTRLLLEKYKEYRVYETPHFKIRLHASEAEAMYPIVAELLENAYQTLTKTYGFEPENPTVFEMFPDHKDFSVRTIGLDTIGASGACFGKVVSVGSPGAMPLNTSNWASVVWHEFTHVITLQLTDYQVPRWFTEGLSEFSEQQRNPSVDRRLDLELYSAHCSGMMRKIEDLNAGFTRPRYPAEVVVCYYQAKLVCEFIVQKYGFAKILEMLALYRGEKKDREVFETVLGVTLDEFDQMFVSWLEENLFAQMNVFPSIDENEIRDLQDRFFADPSDVEACMRLTLGYLQQRKYVDAEIYAAKLMELAGDRALGYDVMGFLAYQQGNAKQAKNLLERAVSLGSNNFYTHWALGMLYLHGFKDISQAIRSFERAKVSYPTYIRANNPYQKLAEIYFAQNRPEKACEELEAYLRLQGMDFKTRIEISQRYIALGQYQPAIRHLNAARDIYPLDVKLNEMLAKSFMALNQWQDAAKVLSTAVALSTGEARAGFCVDLAEVYSQLKEFDKARLYVQKAIEADPKNERARKLLQEIQKSTTPD